MALIWADFPSGSHGIYGTSTSAMLDGPWAQVSSVGLDNDPDPAIGSAGKYPHLTFNGATIRQPLPSAQGVVGIGTRLWVSHLPGNNEDGPYIQWRSSDNTTIAAVRLNSDGSLSFVNGSFPAGTALYTTDGPVITANAWWHIEAKLTCDVGGSAEIEVRVNGVTKINETGFTTSFASVGQIAFAIGGSGAPNPYIKDWVLWDDTGDVDNDFFGTVTVYFREVTETLDIGGWTLSSGDDAPALIGHEGPPADANYISADDSPPAACEFELEDLPEDITSVRGIIPIVRAAKVDGGDGNIQVSLSPNGTDYDDGPDTPITTAFTYWGNATASFVSMKNPETDAPWTPAEFNAARLKINRTV